MHKLGKSKRLYSISQQPLRFHHSTLMMLIYPYNLPLHLPIHFISCDCIHYVLKVSSYQIMKIYLLKTYLFKNVSWSILFPICICCFILILDDSNIEKAFPIVIHLYHEKTPIMEVFLSNAVLFDHNPLHCPKQINIWRSDTINQKYSTNILNVLQFFITVIRETTLIIKCEVKQFWLLINTRTHNPEMHFNNFQMSYEN